MLKRLAILATTAMLAISVSGQPDKGTAKNENARSARPQNQGKNDNQDSQKAPSVIVQVGSQQPNAAETDEEKDTQRELTIYTLWLAVFTAVLAVVSMAQGYFLFRQAGHLEKHGVELQNLASAAKENADAAKDTAAAAFKQGEHIVASERAWITVNPTDLHPPLYPAWEQGTPFTNPKSLTPPVHHQLGLVMKNAGKTPAQIDEFACRYIRIASMDELPNEPECGKYQSQGGHWVIPDDKYYGTVDLETDNGVLYERHIQELKSRSSLLFVFGILKYRDVYENSRETRFGFHYEFPIPGTVAADGSELVPCFRKAGPKTYNSAT